MKFLCNENIRLRAIEPEDLDILYEWENDSSLWIAGSTLAPYSRFLLREYIAEAHRDIYDIKQIRLIIEELEHYQPVGMIDLFDFEPLHKRASIGILIAPPFQKRNFGTQALNLIINYSFSFLKLHQVYVHISTNNKASLKLFEKIGFKKAGILKDWIQTTEGFSDVIIMQLFNDDFQSV